MPPNTQLEKTGQRSSSIRTNSVRRTSSAKSTTHSNVPSKQRALDGGWGWFIVLGCSLGHFLLVGLARTMGVFFVAWIDKFEQSAGATAWVQSLFNTTRMIVGPAVAILCDYVGCRIVVMIGGVVFGLGLLVSSFAQSLKFLYFSFSLLGGLGGGCIFTPMFIMVNKYFERRKGLAMALSTIGSGLGTLILAPLETLLLGEYGHYGTMLILSAVMLNTMVVGALFRPLESKLNWPRTKPKPIEMQVMVVPDDVEVDTWQEDGESEKQKYIETELEDLEQPLQVTVGDDSDIDENETCSLTDEVKPEADKVTQIDDNKEVVRTGESANEIAVDYDNPQSECSDRTAPKYTGPADKVGSILKKTFGQASPQRRDKGILLKKSPNHNSDRLRASGMKKVPSQASQIKDEIGSVNTVSDSKCSSGFSARFAILKNVTFWIYCFYIGALPCVIQVYVVFIPSIMKERGLSEGQQALVLSIAGAADIAGRFLAGFFFDLDIIRSRRWPTHCCYAFFLGLVVLCNAFPVSLVGFIAIALVWGIIEGGYHSQRATIVSEFITRDQISGTVGFMIFWQGIGNLVSPTVAGYLKDLFGTYSVSFYYGGSVMMLFSLVFLGNFIVVYTKKERKKKQKKLSRQASATA